MIKGFKEFILRGNVVDLAVGIVIGAAFTTVVNSLVKDLLTPLISAVFKQPNFSGLVYHLNGSAFMYGDFLNAAISFLIVAATVYFFVVTPLNALIERSHSQKNTEDPTTKKCPFCISEIPVAAKRCPRCTSMLDGQQASS